MPQGVVDGFLATVEACLSATSSTWGLDFGEAGTKFVTVIRDAYGSNAGFGDTHHNHFARPKDDLLPVVDQAFSALIGH